MLTLAETWKDEAKALELKARQVDDLALRKLMIMRSETLLECANELIKAYLQGLD